MGKKSLENISEHFLELEKRVSKVRFARIEASKRMKNKNRQYSRITSLYGILITFIAIVFSVVNFTELNNFIGDSLNKLFEYQKVSVIILAFSSFITMLTLYVSNKGYGEKTARFQSNYMELTRLHSDIKNFMVYYHLYNIEEYRTFKVEWDKSKCESCGNKKNLDKRLAKKYRIFADKYAALLTQSENHDDIDYKKACKDELERSVKELKNESPNYNNSVKIQDGERRLKVLEVEINRIEKKEKRKKYCMTLFPLIVLVCILFFKGILLFISKMVS